MYRFLFLIPLLAFSCQSVQSGGSDKKWASDISEVEVYQDTSAYLCDTVLAKDHLIELTKAETYRNYQNIERLDAVADYIYNVFAKYADTVYYQEFSVQGETYRNVVCSFGVENDAHVVVGAHYDVCGEQEGADDNASGVVGLLELARLLEGQQLSQQIDIVAYTLEEPPYFRTDHMGSYQHAKSLADAEANVVGMVCLEMIGYFSDKEGSQEYPVDGMGALYGTTGDYISLVSRMESGAFTDQFIHAFTGAKKVKTVHIAAPESMTGIDFSDHLNYWKFGFSALMITDTAFYRNHNYHQKTDVMGTLDIRRMARVIEATFMALVA